MIQQLPLSTWRLRSQFLRDVRHFFQDRNYIEVQTPLLNPGLIIEPFMDYFRVERPTSLKQNLAGITTEFLPASPEANLKQVLCQIYNADGTENATGTPQGIFEIAHSFRAGERGALHSEEFLMLEWYRVPSDLESLMDEAQALYAFLASQPYAKHRTTVRRTRSITELFQIYAGIPTDAENLLSYCLQQGLLPKDSAPQRYDELFFLVFLNAIEPHLGQNCIEFIHGYPPQLSALACVEDGLARRFEIYINGVELANGYQELLQPGEQERRVREAAALRQQMGKSSVPFDVDFQSAWEKQHLPPVAGIALGLERLLMVLMTETSIQPLSPFWR